MSEIGRRIDIDLSYYMFRIIKNNPQDELNYWAKLLNYLTDLDDEIYDKYFAEGNAQMIYYLLEMIKETNM